MYASKPRTCSGSLLVLLLGLGWAMTAGAAETIRLNGTGAGISLVQKLVEVYNRQQDVYRVEIHLPVTGSSGGIRAVMHGGLDISISARGLKDKEKAAGLSESPLARTPLVIAVPAGNQQVSDMTLDKLVDIYSGKAVRWPDGSRLRLVVRPHGDTDNTLLRALSAEMDRAVDQALSRPGMSVAMTDHDSADMIHSIEGAIGTTLLALVVAEQRPLKVLSLQGVQPGIASMRDGSYPLFKTFRVILPQNPGASTRSFVTFLHSEQGHAIIEANGAEAL